MMNEETEQSPFSRPGFIAAAIVVVLLVVLGVIVGVRGATRSPDPQTAAPVTVTTTPSPSASAASPTQTSTTAAGNTTCQPRTATGGQGLTAPPPTKWKFQGTMAYPTSPAVGPYVTTAAGRYCFEHSPAGALFMAANAAAQGSDPATSEKWVTGALARGPYAAGIKAERQSGSSSPQDGQRFTVEGFRVLDYSGTTARIDLGISASVNGQLFSASSVYELVWQDNDWKISTDVPRPIDVARVPDLAGYTPWKA